MDPQLRDMLRVWLGEDDDSVDLDALAARFREDETFRKNFVSELAMLGRIRVVQSPEPRWLKLRDHLGENEESQTTLDYENSIMEKFRQVEDTSDRAGSYWSFRTVLVSLIGLLCLCFLFWDIALRRKQVENSSSHMTESLVQESESVPEGREREVAIVARAAGAVKADGVSLEEGVTLLPGLLELKTGLVKIDFYGGAHVVLEGPAKIEIRSPRSAFLFRGKAVSYVSELGEGFQFGTPDGVVVDHDTSFAVEVADGLKTELHVIGGSVTLFGETVKSGEAVAVDGGAASSIAYQSGKFPRAHEFRLREKEHAERRYKKWVAKAKSLSQDPDVLLHYTMEKQGRFGPSVLNQATADMEARASDGTIVGASWSDGRWSGKPAIHFGHEDDRLLSKIPGAHRAVTFLIWAKVDALTQTQTALILTENPARWGLNGFIPADQLASAVERRAKSEIQIMRWIAFEPEKTALFNIAFRGKKESQLDWVQHQGRKAIYETRRWGNWACYGVTYDLDSEKVTHYHNGEPTNSTSILRKVPLLLDYIEIGNLSTWKSEEQIGVQYRFYGYMDEILIARRAFSAGEMKSFYESGKP